MTLQQTPAEDACRRKRRRRDRNTGRGRAKDADAGRMQLREGGRKNNTASVGLDKITKTGTPPPVRRVSGERMDKD
jgi:hypothetical protein